MEVPPLEEVVTRTAENEAITWMSGAYCCVRMSGKFTVDLAEAVRTRVLNRDNVSMAVDVANLSGIPMSFARELYFAARSRQKGHNRIVLVNPPDYLRGLLNLISDRQAIPSVADFKLLPDDPRLIERQIEELRKSLDGVRENLRRNPLWKYSDREGCWICPYCACPISDTKIVSRVSLPASVVERIHSHLKMRCPDYDPERPARLHQDQMAEVVGRINQEKYAASRERTMELQSRVSELEEKGKWADEMEKGLQVAVERQKHLLPPDVPHLEGLESAIVYRPASKVSGDFYDFIGLGDGRLAVVIGDVSGHGIEAGIIMGMTKKVLQIRVGEIMDLQAAVVRANMDILRDLDKKSFVTAFIAVIDLKKKKLSYVRAGHNPTIVFNASRSPDVLQLEGQGTILGMAGGKAFHNAIEVEEVPLQSGDHIIFYTDGLEEARNKYEEMFGRERIIEVIRAEKDRAMNYVLGSLSHELDRFVAGVPMEDDVTVIGLRIS
jgi:serine phosphatase RsbU (regulator of sigma subunit)